MALFARPSTPAEAQEIARLIADERNGPLRLRALAVHRSQNRAKVPQIAQDLALHRETVLVWIKRFNHHGVAGLETLGSSHAPLFLYPLSDNERRTLCARADDLTTTAEHRLCAKALLLSAQHERVLTIAATLDVRADLVRGWIKRANADGLGWLDDAVSA